MQPGRKFKREWMLSYNASVSSGQDREDTPLHALPGTSDVQVQSEFVNVYIFFSFRIFKNKANFLKRVTFDE